MTSLCDDAIFYCLIVYDVMSVEENHVITNMIEIEGEMNDWIVQIVE